MGRDRAGDRVDESPLCEIRGLEPALIEILYFEALRVQSMTRNSHKLCTESRVVGFWAAVLNPRVARIEDQL